MSEKGKALAEILKRLDADEAAIVALKKAMAADSSWRADTEAAVLSTLKKFDPYLRAAFPTVNAAIAEIPFAGPIAALVFGYAEGPILTGVELWLASCVSDNQARAARLAAEAR